MSAFRSKEHSKGPARKCQIQRRKVDPKTFREKKQVTCKLSRIRMLSEFSYQHWNQEDTEQ